MESTEMHMDWEYRDCVRAVWRALSGKKDIWRISRADVVLRNTQVHDDGVEGTAHPTTPDDLAGLRVVAASR